MAIVLNDITSGYNLSKINANFQNIEDYINDKLLARADTGVAGEAMMERALDMNGNKILNIFVDVNDANSLLTIGAADSRYYNVSGDTLTGPMNANSQIISNLPSPTQPSHPATKAYADAIQADVDSNESHSLRFPEVIAPMSAIAARANSLQGYNNNGAPIPVFSMTDTADLAIKLASTEHGLGASLSALEHGGNVQNLQNFLSFDMFPHLIDNTGVEDAHDGMKYVCELATSLGIPVIQKTGKFRLGRGDGSGSIPYSYDFDLGGAEIIIDPSFTTYDGFTATNPVAPTIHDSSSALVGLINASTSLVAQSAVINGLVNNTDYNGQTLFMRSETTKLYKARGEDVYWLHACRLSHYGRMDNTFKYSTASVAEVITMPGRNAITEVHLPDLDFSENVGALQVFHFKYCTGYRIKGGRVKLRNANNTHQTAIVSIQYSDDVEIDAFSDVHPQYGWNGATTGQTIYTNYTFNFYMVKNFRMKNCTAQGYGWGVVGGGYAWGLYFYNCDLNRYDLHEAAFDYVLIDKCRIGNYGVVGTFCCSLWIRDSKFVFGNLTQPEIANSNYQRCLVGSRPDYGGWADGNLYIENCEVDGYLLDSSSTDSGIAVFKAQVASTSAIGTDTSYAVTPRFWRDIIVDGLRFNRYGLNVNNLIWNSSTDQIMYAPRSIKLKDCDFNNTDILNIQLERFTAEPGSDNTSRTLAIQHYPYIELDNVENINGIAMPAAANTSYWNPLVVMSGLKNTRPGMAKPYFATAHRGKYTLDQSCDIKQFATAYSGFYPSLGVVVKIDGATIGDGVTVPLVVGANTAFVDNWSADGATFIGNYSSTTATTANVLLARFMKMSSCSVLDTTFAFVPTLRVLTPSVPQNTETSVELYVQSGAKLELLHNASSVAVNVPIVAANTGNHVVPVYTTPVTPTAYYTRMAMGARGNQVYLSSLYTTADNIAAVNLIH